MRRPRPAPTVICERARTSVFGGFRPPRGPAQSPSPPFTAPAPWFVTWIAFGRESIAPFQKISRAAQVQGKVHEERRIRRRSRPRLLTRRRSDAGKDPLQILCLKASPLGQFPLPDEHQTTCRVFHPISRTLGSRLREEHVPPPWTQSAGGGGGVIPSSHNALQLKDVCFPKSLA